MEDKKENKKKVQELELDQLEKISGGEICSDLLTCWCCGKRFDNRQDIIMHIIDEHKR